jgi:hypothetical protein
VLLPAYSGNAFDILLSAIAVTSESQTLITRDKDFDSTAAMIRYGRKAYIRLVPYYVECRRSGREGRGVGASLSLFRPDVSGYIMAFISYTSSFISGS